MSRNVTAAFRAAMEDDSRSPRQLAIFKFPVAGFKFYSDQEISSPFAQTYEPLVVEWGELTDMAGGDPQKDRVSEIRQMSMTLWNGGDSPISDLFLVEQPENVIVSIYQWFEGLGAGDAALIDDFVIQDPISYSEVDRLLKLDLVSLSMRYDRPIGEVITTANYPNADSSEIGKEIPLILGTPGEVPTLKIQISPVVTLNGSILTDTIGISVNESLDDLNFPDNNGIIEIGEETILYTTRSEFKLFASTRGGRGFDSTTAAEHITGVEVSLLSNRNFAVCKGPIQAIDIVRVAGIIADTADYVINRFSDPAIIQFPEAPKAISFATGATFLEMQFDDTNAENTAFQSFAAYEGEENLAARLTEIESLLSIKQVTVNPDRGEIVKAFLAVEHWEDGSFLNDFAEVSIEGIGVVGRLSRPTAESTVLIDAEIDIDHGHSHNISGEHTHDFTDPALQIIDPTHGHASSIPTTTTYYPTEPTGIFFTVPFNNFVLLDTWGFVVSPLSWDSGLFSITINAPFSIVRVTVYFGHQSITGAWSFPIEGTIIWKGDLTGIDTFNIGLGIGSGPSNQNRVAVRIEGAGQAINATVTIGDMTFDAIRGADILPSPTGTYPETITSGSNVVSTDKATDDVQDFTGDNILISDVDSDIASSTIVNLFDITTDVDFDWSWFSDRDVTIQYQGTNDNRKIYVRHVFFDVEYRKRETVFSDDITCEPVGLIDDASGTVTGTPNKLITRPDEVRKYVLTQIGDMPDSFIDDDSFSSAGTRYGDLEYLFDGVLDGGLTVRDVEKRLAFQCRSRWFWNEGVAKIALREKVADQTAVKFLTPEDLQLRSIKVDRQRVTDISNVIDLQYSKDSTNSDKNPFTKILSDSDLNSISVNGNYEHRDKWEFDMVSSDTMATDLLSYYIDTQATPSTFYTFNIYLKHFDLEKGDVIGLSSSFGKLIKTLMEIKSIDRMYGSGRNQSINRLKVTAESIRYALISIGLTDAVTVLESILISFGSDLQLEDAVFVGDDLVFSISGTLSDSVTVSDTIVTISEFVTVLTETVTVSEAQVFDMGLSLTEEQFVFDSIAPQIVIGYGGGGFGSGVRFGGLTLISEFLADLIVASEVIVMAQTATFEDELTTIDEQLNFASGFGTPVGDGFGSARYGS